MSTAVAVVERTGTYVLSSLGLEMQDVIPSFDEWDALGAYLRTAERSVQWWVGDWVRLGEREYGEMFSQLLDSTEWDVDTIQQYRWVAERVPFKNRRADLSFSHHREVADLDPDQQAEWLARAVSGDEDTGRRWTVERLRRELNAVKREKALTYWVTIEATDASDAQTLADRMRAEGRKVKVR